MRFTTHTKTILLETAKIFLYILPLPKPKRTKDPCEEYPNTFDVRALSTWGNRIPNEDQHQVCYTKSIRNQYGRVRIHFQIQTLPSNTG